MEIVFPAGGYLPMVQQSAQKVLQLLLWGPYSDKMHEKALRADARWQLRQGALLVHHT